MATPGVTYRKRLDGGVGKDDGRDYECALHHAVAVNALAHDVDGEQTSEEDGLDCLDDLAFHHRGELILVQAKYCNKLKGRVTLDNLRAKKHDFSLETYHKAYLVSKQHASTKGETVKNVILFSNRVLEKTSEMFEEIERRDQLPSLVRALLEFPASAGQKFYRVASAWLESPATKIEDLMHCSSTSGVEDRAKRQEFLSKVILALNQPDCNELQNIVRGTFSTLAFCLGKSDQDVDQARRKLIEEITDWVKRRDKELTPWTVHKSREVLERFDRHLQMQKLRGLADGNRHKATQYLSISVQPGVALPPRSGTVATRQPWVCAQLAVGDTPWDQAVLLTAEQFAAQPSLVLDGLGGLVVLHDKASPGPVRRRDLQGAVAARGGLLLTNDVEEQDEEWLVRADQLTNDCLDDILEAAVDVQGRSLTLRTLFRGDSFRARRFLGPATIEKLVVGKSLSVGQAVSPPLLNDTLLGPEHYIERCVSASQQPTQRQRVLASASQQAEGRPLSEQQLAERQRVVVSAPAGMGKSSLLRSVAARMGEAQPGQWTLLCDLREKKDTLQQAGLPSTAEECKALLRKLLTIADGDDGELERSVLDSGLEAPGVVELLFDGYDEVHHEGGQAFMQLLQWLGKTEAGVWVTTRDQSVEELLSAVKGPEAFCIQGLTEDDQDKLWTSLDPRVSMMEFQHLPDSKRFFENPLHMTMLYQISHRLTADERNLGLCLHSLYKKFVEYKFEVFWQRKAIGNDNIRTVLERPIVEAHQQMAIRALYAEGWRDFADPVDLNRSVEDLVRDALEPDFGLLRVSEKGSILFVHQTFAEFFASHWLHSKLKDARPPVDAKLRALLDRVMTEMDSRAVRTFLDDQLVVAGTQCSLKKERLVFHSGPRSFLYVPVEEELPSLSCFLWRFRDALSKTEWSAAFFMALKVKLLPFVEQALQDADFKATVAGLRLLGVPPLGIAATMTWVLDLQRFDARLTLLLRLLLGLGCRVNDRAIGSEMTALHFAAAHGNLCAARLLLEEGCATDHARLELLQSVDFIRQTPLHHAAHYYGEQGAKCVEFLIDEEVRLLQRLHPSSSSERSNSLDEDDFSRCAKRLSLYRRDTVGRLPLACVGPLSVLRDSIGLLLVPGGTDIDIDEMTSEVRVLWGRMTDESLMKMAGVEPARLHAVAKRVLVELLTWHDSRPDDDYDPTVLAHAFALGLANPPGGDWNALRSQAVAKVGFKDAGALLRIALTIARNPLETRNQCDLALRSARQNGTVWSDAFVLVLCHWWLDLETMYRVSGRIQDSTLGGLPSRPLAPYGSERSAGARPYGASEREGRPPNLLSCMRPDTRYVPWDVREQIRMRYDVVRGVDAVRGGTLRCSTDQTDDFSHEVLSVAAELKANASRGRQDWVQLLVARAADVRLARDARRLAEAWPQLDGAAEVLRWATVVQSGTLRDLALHYAVLAGSTSAVDLLAKSGRCDVNAKHQGQSPLHAAARRRRDRDVEALLAAGCDASITDAVGRTALHVAASAGSEECVRMLLAAGCDPAARDTAGQTALHCAASSGSRQCVQALLKAGCGPAARDAAHQTALLVAADSAAAKADETVHQHVSRLLHLLRQEDAAVADFRDESGRTALHFAVILDCDLLVPLLLAAGCDPRAVDVAGQSVLHYATRVRSYWCLETLLEAGCDLSARDAAGQTALHCAASSGSYECMEVLLKAGCDSSIRDATGQTALPTLCRQSESVRMRHETAQGGQIR